MKLFVKEPQIRRVCFHYPGARKVTMYVLLPITLETVQLRWKQYRLTSYRIHGRKCP